jgi:hypothetical protein
MGELSFPSASGGCRRTSHDRRGWKAHRICAAGAVIAALQRNGTFDIRARHVGAGDFPGVLLVAPASRAVTLKGRCHEL